MPYLRRSALVLSLLAVLLASSGCIYSREIQHTRREIERANPELDLDRQISANVGPVTLRFARWITSRVDDEDARLASKYLRDIRRVKVGVYNVRTPDVRLGGVSELRRFNRPGWELAASIREDGENTWISYRERRGKITDVYAIVHSDDELVIARLSGRLTRMVEEAIRDHTDLSSITDFARRD